MVLLPFSLLRRLLSLVTVSPKGSRLRRLTSKVSEVGQSRLLRDDGEDEKDAANYTKKQTYDPEPAFLCERGNRRDGNRDLEHGHAARKHFVLVKVCFRCGFFAFGFRFDLFLLFLITVVL